MNDPHVVSLHYQFSSEVSTDDYSKAAPLKTTLGPFDIELEDSILTVRPHNHYPNSKEAQAAFEPYLRSWESSVLLHPGRYRIKFTYKSAKVIDRAPSPGKHSLYAEGRAYGVSGHVATLTRGVARYPGPYLSFQASALTDELITRFKQYLDGQEPLTSMANWVLTRLIREYGSSKEVASALNVSSRVINNLSRLAASTDPVHGRKAAGSGPNSLSGKDITRIQDIVVCLIQRVGEVEAVGQAELRQITWNDFS